MPATERFYWQHFICAEEVLPAQSLPQCLVCSFCWYTGKLPIWILCIALIDFPLKDEREVNKSDISSALVLYDIYKQHNLSVHCPLAAYSRVLCIDILQPLLIQSLIITCNNQSFRNCTPQCQIINRVFRITSPPQPSSSPANCTRFMCFIWDTSGETLFRVGLSRLQQSIPQILCSSALLHIFKPLMVYVAGHHLTEQEGGVT